MPRISPSTEWAICLATLCAVLLGCRTLSNRGPVSQSVATCRQLTQQGVNAMEKGDWKRAESLLARAVEASPTDAQARRSYAEALWHRGATQDALPHFEQARRVAGEDPGLAVRAGELYLALGRISDAGNMVDEALRFDPKFAAAWSLRGKIATARGDHQAALANYQRGLGYAPGDRETTILVAEAYRRMNEPQRALGALQSLSESYSPGEEPQQVLFLEGLALGALGRHDDAAQRLGQAARRAAPTPEILCCLAEAEMLAGRAAGAQTALAQALALDPEHAASRELATRLGTASLPSSPVRR